MKNYFNIYLKLLYFLNIKILNKFIKYIKLYCKFLNHYLIYLIIDLYFIFKLFIVHILSITLTIFIIILLILFHFIMNYFKIILFITPNKIKIKMSIKNAQNSNFIFKKKYCTNKIYYNYYKFKI